MTLLERFRIWLEARKNPPTLEEAYLAGYADAIKAPSRDEVTAKLNAYLHSHTLRPGESPEDRLNRVAKATGELEAVIQCICAHADAALAEEQQSQYQVDAAARQQRWRDSGELPQRLSELVWDYCWHCEGWHCVCPLNGCNSCAGGCPHGLAKGDDKGCQPWWDVQNTPECAELEKQWHHPMLQQTIDAVHMLNSEQGQSQGCILRAVINQLLRWSIPFEVRYGSNHDFEIRLLDEATVSEEIAKDNLRSWYPANRRPRKNFPSNLAQ